LAVGAKTGFAEFWNAQEAEPRRPSTGQASPPTRIYENIDTGSPLGKAMFTIVAAVAELERNIIVERIRGGIRRAKEQGKRLGRRPLTDPSLLRTFLQMKAQGKSIRAIAEAIRGSKSFVHKTCRNHLPKSLEKSA
jgi:DNA invertase Pin-like site-specific DNA recombinase